MMTARLHIAGLAAALIALAACTSGTEGAYDATAAADPEQYAPDSAALDTVAEPETIEPDTILNCDIATAAEAIDFMESTPGADRYRRGILPAMSKDNLDYCKRLLQSPHDYFIVVDKPSMNVVLFNRYGVEIHSYKMACSRHYGTKHKRRDNRTPEGFFSAEGIYNSTEWLYTDDDGNTSQTKGQFGPRFIRLKTDVTTQVGIHGTCSPWSLGKRVSHGCIRIHNDNILELVKYVEVGTPIIVNPSKRDQQINIEEGCDIPSINIGKTRETPVEKPKTDTVTKPDSIVAPDTSVMPAAPDSAEIVPPMPEQPGPMTDIPDTISPDSAPL